MTDPIARARDLVSSSSSILAFTGAGVSAESGVPTYRGAGGVWTEYDPAKYADISYFRQDPTYYWSFFRDVRYPALAKSRPNPAHLAIAALERSGKVSAVITQNIDGLHQAAGSTRVIELHGNSRVIYCLGCDARLDFTEAYRLLDDSLPPKCPKCSGALRPQVVFFGEALPPGVMEESAELAASCDLFLVVGSTLAVQPACSLPLVARRSGAPVIIVNVGPTVMDEIAEVRIDAKAGEVLPQIVGSDVAQ
jgi:NAD-dependent deacetylase